jgi:hypothetical protein
MTQLEKRISGFGHGYLTSFRWEISDDAVCGTINSLFVYFDYSIRRPPSYPVARGEVPGDTSLATESSVL